MLGFVLKQWVGGRRLVPPFFMPPPELFPTPAPEGVFDTQHKVRLCTFGTKMTTHRDN